MIEQLQSEILTLSARIQDAMADTNGTSKEMSESELKEFNDSVGKLESKKAQLATALKAKALVDEANRPVGGIQIAPTAPSAKGADAPDLAKQYFSALKKSERNDEYRAAMIADYVAKDYQVQVGPRGGYFVTPLMVSTDIIQRAERLTYVRQLTGHKFTVTGADSIGAVYADDISDFEWKSEIATITASTDSPFELRELSPKRLSKLIKISRKLLRHSNMAETEIMRLIVRSKAYTEEKAFISGTGVGQPLGFMTPSDQGVSTSRDQSTAAANTVTYDDIVNALALVEGGYRNRLVAMAHRNMEARLRKVKDTANQYIWLPVAPNTTLAQGLSAAMPSSLLGFPFLVSEFMPDPGVSNNITTGLRPLAFANFNLGYGIADDLLMEIVPMEETFASSNQIGYTFNSALDGMPVDQRAFSRVLVA